MTDALVLEGADGTITVAAGVLAQIVQHATDGVEGARVRRRRRGLDVQVDAGRARVELELAVRFGDVLPDVARSVQEQVGTALARMCGLELEAVDVSIEELDGA
jgi:uncharacterized alkaline shock family protein YloU